MVRVADLEAQQLIHIGDLYKINLLFDMLLPFFNLPIFACTFEADRFMLFNEREDLTLQIILGHGC